MNKGDQYESYISLVNDSHKTHISAMQWFEKNFHFQKNKGLLTTNDSGESTLLATLGEDGQALIWDLKEYDLQSRGETSPYSLRPILRVDINKIDSK